MWLPKDLPQPWLLRIFRAQVLPQPTACRLRDSHDGRGGQFSNPLPSFLELFERKNGWKELFELTGCCICIPFSKANKGANGVEPDREHNQWEANEIWQGEKNQVREAKQKEKGEKYSKEVVHVPHQQGVTWSAKFCLTYNAVQHITVINTVDFSLHLENMFRSKKMDAVNWAWFLCCACCTINSKEGCSFPIERKQQGSMNMSPTSQCVLVVIWWGGGWISISHLRLALARAQPWGADSLRCTLLPHAVTFILQVSNSLFV